MTELSHHINRFAHYQWLVDHSALANETKEKPGAELLANIFFLKKKKKHKERLLFNEGVMELQQPFCYNEGLYSRTIANTWKMWKQKVGKRVGYQQRHFASEFTNPRIIYLQTSAMRNNKPLFGLRSHLGS